jgi:hypothetical protein
LVLLDTKVGKIEASSTRNLFTPFAVNCYAYSLLIANGWLLLVGRRGLPYQRQHCVLFDSFKDVRKHVLYIERSIAPTNRLD